jgi:hypothetical protein
VASAANRDPGQASVELVAVLPALVVCVVLAAQAVAAGWALWSAGNAARAGARAERIGSDGEAAARRSLPSPLREGAKVRAENGVEVSVRVLALLPGITLPRIAASSSLDAPTS